MNVTASPRLLNPDAPALVTGSYVSSLRLADAAPLSDVWVEIRSERRLDPSAPTALIVGSAIEHADQLGTISDAQALEQSCTQIAAILADQGFNIINNACPGIPDLVMRGYTARATRGLGVELSILKSPKDTSSTRAFAPDGFPLSGDVTVFCDAGFETLSPTNPKCADCVIVVGGGLGSLAEAATCVMQGLPMISYDAQGGVAREIEPLFGRYLTKYRQLRATTCSDFQSFEQALAAFTSDFHANGERTKLVALIHAISRSTAIAEPAFRISIDARGSCVTYALGAETVRIENPPVLVDRVAMAKDEAADDWLGAVSSADRTYEIDGVALTMSRTQLDMIWGPSIETVMLVDALKDELATGRRPTAALNVCSGAGMLALWLAAHTSALVLGVDVSSDAVLCADINAVGRPYAHRLSFKVANFHLFEPDGLFDLIVSNPPYLPHPWGSPTPSSSVMGVELLLDLLLKSPERLSPRGVGYVSLSSCSLVDPRVAEAIAYLKRSRTGERVCSRPTPLKVSAVAANPAWIRFFCESGGLVRRERDGYPYWHTVEIWRLHRAPDGFDADQLGEDAEG